MPKKQPIPVPDHLSERSKTLWNDLVPRRAESRERLTLLQAGLEALDRADLARVAIAAEGMTSKTATTGALHVHPLVKVEREARQQFIKVFELLELSWWQPTDGDY